MHLIITYIEFYVGTYNSTRKRYTEPQELLSFLEDVIINPQFIAGLVNGVTSTNQPKKLQVSFLTFGSNMGWRDLNLPWMPHSRTTFSPPYREEGHSPSA
jgi:hypothetical protein